MNIVTICIVIAVLVMFGGALKLLLTKLVNAMLPLATSLEVYAEGVEAKTRINVTRDVAKLEAEASSDLKTINEARARVELPETKFDL